MANLDFLGSPEEQKKSEEVAAAVKELVSTGNGNILPTELHKYKVEYDKSMANETVKFEAPTDSEYMKRAIKKINDAGFVIAPSWKTAIKLRAASQKVVTLHEADIILRKDIDLTNKFLLTAFIRFDAFFTEEDANFREGVFYYRTRYNKGVKWLEHAEKTNVPSEKIKLGIERLAVISEELVSLGFPIHPEEAMVGLHVEFLKPEFMTFTQFSQATAASERYKSLQEQEQKPFQKTLI